MKLLPSSLEVSFSYSKTHEYDRIQKESWKEARVEVPLMGFMFKYIDSVNTLQASWLEKPSKPQAC